MIRTRDVVTFFAVCGVLIICGAALGTTGDETRVVHTAATFVSEEKELNAFVAGGIEEERIRESMIEKLQKLQNSFPEERSDNAEDTVKSEPIIEEEYTISAFPPSFYEEEVPSVKDAAASSSAMTASSSSEIESVHASSSATSSPEIALPELDQATTTAS